MITWIKICGLSEPRTVIAAVDAGVQAIGFVFAPSVRQITPKKAQQLAAQVPSSVSKVAVFLRPLQSDIDRVLEHFTPDYVQADWQSLASIQLPSQIGYLPVYRQGQDALVEMLPDQLLFEGAKSGHGETVDWHDARAVAKTTRMILAGGLDANNVEQALSIVRPYGVDVSSGVERSRGEKSSALIAQFVQTIRTCDEHQNNKKKARN